MCDHKLRFKWIDIQWPMYTSIYISWVTSILCHYFDVNDDTKRIIPVMTIVVVNAYVKKRYISVPKGQEIGYPNA